jgi:fimbrial chaperone protein
MLRALVPLLFPLALLAADPGKPGGFFVSPVQVYLSAKTPTGSLTLRNQNPDPSRFQLTVFAWEQDQEGEPRLTPTQDILFSPPLLILAPGEERKIRLACRTDFGSIEKSYRLLIEELRPPKRDSDSEDGPQLRMMTNFSLPIFLLPPKVLSQGRIENLKWSGFGGLFQLRSTGNVHMQVQAISIKGIGPSGNTVLERRLDGRYVLAGTIGIFEAEYIPSECARLKSLRVDVTAPHGTASEEFEVPPDSCAK